MSRSMGQLRIALFTYSTKPRGSVIHTLELAEALQDLGHDVTVYALDKDGRGFDRRLRCRYYPVPAQPAPADLDRLIQQRIQEWIDELGNGHFRRQPYDCYHAQDCLSANALAILRQQRQIPQFVRTVHHIDEFNSSYLQQCQDRSIREADLCLCVSQHWQHELQRQYGIHAPRVINGVRLARFAQPSASTQARLQEQYGMSGSPIYLTVGGIEPRKNSIRLLHAFAQVRLYHPTAQLVIAGGATLFDYHAYREQFQTTVRDLGLEPSLILPGVVSDADLPTLYHLADAFVFPSLKEGWGLVVLEAIAAGLPVIASDQPPFTEFLTSQQALLVDPESVAAIATAMRQILDPDIAASLRHHAQPLCEQFSWEKSATMHVDHYRQLLNS